MAHVSAEQIQEFLDQMHTRDCAESLAKRTLERARYGTCVACGFTLDGGWSANYCRACSPCELDFFRNTASRSGG